MPTVCIAALYILSPSTCTEAIDMQSPDGPESLVGRLRALAMMHSGGRHAGTTEASMDDAETMEPNATTTSWIPITEESQPSQGEMSLREWAKFVERDMQQRALNDQPLLAHQSHEQMDNGGIVSSEGVVGAGSSVNRAPRATAADTREEGHAGLNQVSMDLVLPAPPVAEDVPRLKRIQSFVKPDARTGTDADDARRNRRRSKSETDTGFGWEGAFGFALGENTPKSPKSNEVLVPHDRT